MADATRNDEELASLQGDRATVLCCAADGESSAEDEKHLVFMGVGMPGEFSLDARHLDVLIVYLTYDSRRPKLR